jgi:bifunctional DNA-binding transcriptional regulator/antitoxin component of YhaV-PrlF toxin-antitoxin module
MGSMFDNNDDFGIQYYRDDCNYLMQINEVKVVIKRKSKAMVRRRQGEIMGEIAETITSEGEIIKINIMSLSQDKLLKKGGYDNTGTQEYDCVCAFDININNKDEIILIQDNKFGLKPGDMFKVDIGDVGLYQSQYTRKFFKLIKIGHKNL